MGDPKKQRKKFQTPRFAWSIEQLQAELSLLGEYGLRNKRELWRHREMLSKYRRRARELLALSPEERTRFEKQLLDKLYSMGLTSENATLDDILDLSIGDILERRLQTIVLRRGLAQTPSQARMIIIHGHISLGVRRVTVPGYIVQRAEESFLTYAPTSPFSKLDHPFRKDVDVSGTADATREELLEGLEN